LFDTRLRFYRRPPTESRRITTPEFKAGAQHLTITDDDLARVVDKDNDRPL
jgi:hypothetical protein